jgi:hypothetical protein
MLRVHIREEGPYEHTAARSLLFGAGRGCRRSVVVWVERAAPTPIDQLVPWERGRTAVFRRACAVRRHRLLQH